MGQPDTAEYKRRDTKEIRNKAERPNSKDYDIQSNILLIFSRH